MNAATLRSWAADATARARWLHVHRRHDDPWPCKADVMHRARLADIYGLLADGFPQAAEDLRRTLRPPAGRAAGAGPSVVHAQQRDAPRGPPRRAVRPSLDRLRPPRRWHGDHDRQGPDFTLARPAGLRERAVMRRFLLVLFLSIVPRTTAGPLDFWTCSLVLTNATVSDAIFANGKFIVSMGGGPAGRSSTMTSEDGVSWRETREERLWGFCTGNGVIVGRGGDSIVSTSDGVSWIARRPFLVDTIRGLTFGQGRFVAQVGGGSVGDPIRLWTSPDGMGWAMVATNFWPESFARISFVPELCYSGNRWVTLTEPFEARSLLLPEPLQSFDGMDFSPNPNWPSFRRLRHNGTSWAGILTDNYRLVSTSRDGMTWTTIEPNSNWGDNIKTLTAYEGRFFASGWVNYFFESTDGIRWTDHEVDVRLSTKWYDRLTVLAPIVAGNNRAVAFAAVSTPPTNNTSGAGKLPVARFYVSQPLTNSIVPELGMASLPALKLEAGTVGSGYHVEASEAVGGPWRRVATVFPTNFPFTFLAPEGEQRGRFYRAVVRD